MAELVVSTVEARPLSVQVPLACTVVVPIATPFLYTVMLDPTGSTEVPVTLLEPVIMGLLTTGAIVARVCTVTAFEGFDRHEAADAARTVRVWPEVSVRPLNVKAPAAEAVVEATR